MAAEEKASVYSMAALIDDLRNEDVKKRLNSIKNLAAIAKALGPERTRGELIPFLSESTDDEDEVLVNLAETLGGFTELVGGPGHVLPLVKLLETLACAEETIVRDQAIESLKKVLALARIKEKEAEYAELIKRLVNNPDTFTAKIAGIAIIPVCYQQLSPSLQQEMINIYRTLAKDGNHQIRKAVAINLKFLILQIPKYPEIEAVSLFQLFSTDEQDVVRFYCVENLLALGQVIPYHKSGSYLLNFIKACAEDKSWRVRFMLTDKIVDVGKCLDHDGIVHYLSNYFANFLQDTESEVRTIAATRIGDFCKFLDGPTIVKKIVPALKKLATDSFVHVRKALAENLLAVAPLIGGSNTSEHIVPLFLSLLKDENSDVRLPLLRNIEDLNKVIGVETLSLSLVPAINQLAGEKKWRTRLTIIEYFPILAKIMGETAFNERFGGMCLSWLDDNVFAIREAAMQNLKQLTAVLGSKWAERIVLPKLFGYQTNSNYLFRLIPLFAIPLLAPELSPECIEKTVVPFILNQVNDKVPNVRFNSAKVLKSISQYVKSPPLQAAISKALSQLAADSDADVRYYSSKYVGTAAQVTY